MSAHRDILEPQGEREILIAINERVRTIQQSLEEVKEDLNERYATKEYVQLMVDGSRTTEAAEAPAAQTLIGHFATSKVGVGLGIVTVILALLGVVNMLGENSPTSEDMQAMIRTEVQLLAEQQTSLLKRYNSSGGSVEPDETPSGDTADSYNLGAADGK